MQRDAGDGRRMKHLPDSAAVDQSAVLGEIYELCEGCGEFMVGYFAETFLFRS